MRDQRVTKLANRLINYSMDLKKGENVLIEMFDGGEELSRALIDEINKVGANVFISTKSREMMKRFLINATDEQIKLAAKFECDRMDKMDGYIALEGAKNKYEFKDVPADKICSFLKYYSYPLHWERRIPNTKWIQLTYPSSELAQQSGMTLEQFEDLYYNSSLMDYTKMSNAMDALLDYMNKTDKVTIIAKDTDLSFSIKGLPARKCIGNKNVPDGEVYSGPVIDSANGYITFNFPTDVAGVDLGGIYENVRLELKNGKIIKATCDNDTEKLNAILDIDEGSRYFGEFALGFNPHVNITRPTTYIMIDEIVPGSLHLAAGHAYAASDNGNRSALHWDFIQMHTPEYGGGEIWFDDVLIRKDGKYIIEELECLNPENLI